MKLTEQELHRSQFSHFLGKNITVITTASALPLQHEEGHLLHYKTFGGICEGFDEFGVWLFDPKTQAKSFFFFKDTQGYVENPVLPDDHPLVVEAMQKVKTQQVAKEATAKGKEIMESMGEMSVTDFQKLFKEQVKR